MKRCPRLALVVAVLLLLAAALILWAGRKNNNAGVALVFIGFTNQSLPVVQSQPQPEATETDLDVATKTLITNVITRNSIFGRTYRISSARPGEVKVPVALILATNSGSVPVTLYASIVRKVVSPNPSLLELDEDFAIPLRTGLPRVLKPGQAIIVQAQVLVKSQTWRTEFSYQRNGFREQLYAKTWASGNSIIRGFLSSVFSRPALTPAKCGPITNLPPIEVSVGPSTLFPFSAFSTPPIRINTNEFLFDKVLPNDVIRRATPPRNDRYDLIDFRQEPPKLEN